VLAQTPAELHDPDPLLAFDPELGAASMKARINEL
jgi:hypothetical protein